MLPDKRGYFGDYGGRYVPETLVPALADLAYVLLKPTEWVARAVVAISRIERLGPESAAEADHPEVASAPLTRIASDDPNVVIYWQFDSNGG